jgi:integrase
LLRTSRATWPLARDAPKTEGSEREIPYGDLVREALERLADSERKAPGFLFVTALGNLFTAQEVTKRVFRALAQALRIPAFTWRSFRRSAETALHTGGVPLKVQQEILGHSNPNMTLLYADPDIADRRKVLGRLDALLLPTVAKLEEKLPEARPS